MMFSMFIRLYWWQRLSPWNRCSQVGGTKACCRLDEDSHQRPFGKRGFATPNNTDECAHRSRSPCKGTVGETTKGNRDGCYHSQIDINRAFPARSRSVSYSRTEGLPISLTNKHCIFCVFRPHHQCYFSTSRKSREHFEKHMRGFERDGPIWCPDDFCQLVLHGHQSLKEHADQCQIFHRSPAY